MRRGWEGVGLMAFICMLLAVTVDSVQVQLWGPSWLSPVLFGWAAASCVLVLAWPDNALTRAGSGVQVSAAFSWRGVSAFVDDLFYHGSRPLFAVVLYVGFAAYISLTWHRVLPAPGSVRSRLRDLTGDG